MDKWSFDVFKVAEFSSNRPLSCIMYAIFQVRGGLPLLKGLCP